MSRQAWLIVLFGLAFLLVALAVVGPFIGLAAGPRVWGFAALFFTLGHFLKVLP